MKCVVWKKVGLSRRHVIEQGGEGCDSEKEGSLQRVVQEWIGNSRFSNLIKIADNNFILIYHGIVDRYPNRYNARHVSTKCFEKQIHVHT